MRTPTGSRGAHRLVLHTLVILALGVLQAVAHATPAESLHVPGFHDGGDYDSVIQPRILALSGLPDGPVPQLARLEHGTDRLDPVGCASLPERGPSVAQPRAPPVR